MFHRWTSTCLLAAALIASGCSGAKTTTTTATATASSTASSVSASEATETAAEPTLAPQDPLNPDACIDLAGASLNLVVATNAEQAQAAADVFSQFTPPKSVQEAIDHFVGTGGAHSNDPDYERFDARITNWMNAVCPL